MVARLIGDVLLDECAACHGVFVDCAALERIMRERRQARAEAILGLAARPSDPSAPSGQEGRMYVKCPDCDTLMNRRSFASGAGVIIDVCKNHGTWFDANELPRVVDFVMNGGLEAAAKKDAQRLKDEARREKARARAAGAAMSRTSSVSHSADRVGVFGELLGSIACILLD